MPLADALVAAAVAGDPAALDAVLAAVRPTVLRRCSRILPYPHDAEEAAQDALLTIAHRIGDFTGRGSFEGWVGAIATNQARMTYRSLRRRFGETGLEQAAAQPDPHRVSIIAGSRLDLLDAIDELERAHPETVEPFLLRDLGTLPYDEIATLTDAPLGTVKARIHTARRFLRPLLAELR